MNPSICDKSLDDSLLSIVAPLKEDSLLTSAVRKEPAVRAPSIAGISAIRSSSSKKSPSMECRSKVPVATQNFLKWREKKSLGEIATDSHQLPRASADSLASQSRANRHQVGVFEGILTFAKKQVTSKIDKLHLTESILKEKLEILDKVEKEIESRKNPVLELLGPEKPQVFRMKAAKEPAVFNQSTTSTLHNIFSTQTSLASPSKNLTFNHTLRSKSKSTNRSSTGVTCSSTTKRTASNCYHIPSVYFTPSEMKSRMASIEARLISINLSRPQHSALFSSSNSFQRPPFVDGMRRSRVNIL